jgi:translation initiation factor 1A
LVFRGRGKGGQKRPEMTDEEKQEQIRRTRLPNKDELEMLGIVTQRVGGNHIMVMCDDGEERNCRIPGKMRKRVWMRPGDVVIIKLWDFQPSKADVAWRYSPIQAEHLRKKGYLDKIQA